MAAVASGDGLVRWLLGGLLAGGVVLGVVVAVRELAGDDGNGGAAPPSASVAVSTPTSTAGSSPGAAADRGRQLFAADGCAGCHSLDGSAGAGPTIKGLAGSRVRLSDGRTVVADDAYLATAIAKPDAEIVDGYQKGVMSAATSSVGLAGKPQDVAALVAYVKTRR